MAKVKIKIEGMDKLQKSLKKLGNVPQKHVTSASRKGMNVVLRGAKAKAPSDTGDLKRGTVLAGEKSRHKGKKVYRLVFAPSMNNVFQKPIKKPGSRGGKGNDTAYYPISQEYGYFAGDGKYIPGFRFIRGSFDSNMPKAAKIMVDTMKQKLDQEIAKAGLK